MLTLEVELVKEKIVAGFPKDNFWDLKVNSGKTTQAFSTSKNSSEHIWNIIIFNVCDNLFDFYDFPG